MSSLRRSGASASARCSARSSGSRTTGASAVHFSFIGAASRTRTRRSRRDHGQPKRDRAGIFVDLQLNGRATGSERKWGDRPAPHPSPRRVRRSLRSPAARTSTCTPPGGRHPRGFNRRFFASVQCNQTVCRSGAIRSQALVESDLAVEQILANIMLRPIARSSSRQRRDLFSLSVPQPAVAVQPDTTPRPRPRKSTWVRDLPEGADARATVVTAG